MKLRGWPRSIRFQLPFGLVLLEALSLALFATVLIRQQYQEIFARAQVRLEHQSTSLALQAVEALQADRPEAIAISARMMSEAPSVESAKISDPQGRVTFVGEGQPADHPLTTAEISQIQHVAGDSPHFFNLGSEDWEGVKPIYFQAKLYGYAWVKTDRNWDRQQLGATLRYTAIFGIIWIAASVILAWGLARSITGPLAVLHRGTRALMRSPEGETNFPLPVTVHNEIGDLIEAFNRMVASIEEQRNGLSDTLSLLDSMLANAPIGLAFFDKRCRFVRVNQ